MNCFVIARSIDGGKTAMDYLGTSWYWWVGSGAVARWFHTAQEAQVHIDERQHICPNAFVFPYNPIETLVNPTETDRTAMVQDALRGMLAEGS